MISFVLLVFLTLVAFSTCQFIKPIPVLGVQKSLRADNKCGYEVNEFNFSNVNQ